MARLLVGMFSITLLFACARPPTKAPLDRPNATVSLKSAIVTSSVEPRVITISCLGGGFCREDVLPEDAASDDVEELRDACAHRRGTVSTSPCPRAHVLASCSGGTITVRTYAQEDPKEQAEALGALTEACDALGGLLETTRVAEER